MTIGIGLKCSEGVVLVTDSMTTITDQIARPTPVPNSRKSFWLKPARTNVIVSGIMSEELFGARQETAFAPAVNALFDDLVAFEKQYLAQFPPAVARYLAGGDDPDLQDFPQLLAGGGPTGEPPQLACLKPSGTQWAASSALFAVGCWTYGWLEPQGRMSHPVPTTLEGCKQLAVGWAREYLGYAYDGRTLDEHMAAGNVISVGFPLFLTVIGDVGFSEEVIPA